MMSPESDPSAKRDKGLEQCPDCDSGLVQPIRWEQANKRSQWKIWRRCPECEWTDVSVFGEMAIDAYDVVLDAGTKELNGTLSQITQENMETVVNAFTEGLERDLIGPDDFRN